MFELSVACKYLIPRRRQLSVSIISLISILVISLVVWLIVVFFSVTEGLEKNWVQKLTSLTAPVRITPTSSYYNSYYHQIDSISDASNYSLKTIQEKKETENSNPYDEEYDQEVPAFWPEPDLDEQGNLKDIVKLAYASLDEIKNVKGLKAQNFELTASHINIFLKRFAPTVQLNNFYGTTTQSSLSYPAYLGNFVGDNPYLKQTLLPINAEDLNNYLSSIDIVNEPTSQDFEQNRKTLPATVLKEKLDQFFAVVTVKQLKTQSFGWTIPLKLLPSSAVWKACVLKKDQQILRIIVPTSVKEIPQLLNYFESHNLTLITGELKIEAGQLFWGNNQSDFLLVSHQTPLTLVSEQGFKATLMHGSLEKARRAEEVRFQVTIPVQDSVIEGDVAFRGLKIAAFNLVEGVAAPWAFYEKDHYILPEDTYKGAGILLPKSFREAGVLVGDMGSLIYYSPTATIIQEHFIPVFAAGFYDPGIIPIGGKFLLANQNVIQLIRSSHEQDDKNATSNGINVQFDNLKQADEVKQALLTAFRNKGIQRYWEVQTYREYDFTKEIMQELQSQKYLFMLIAVVIILVACSNIISMLIILVNDKKHEIGILRAMGANSKSISLIFGLAGASIGIVGSVLGIILATFTLYHLDSLVSILSVLQGHEMFSSNLYGKSLPSQISYEALFFVSLSTLIISLLAGIVPAVKACLVRPSTTLRSSGG